MEIGKTCDHMRQLGITATEKDKSDDTNQSKRVSVLILLLLCERVLTDQLYSALGLVEGNACLDATYPCDECLRLSEFGGVD